MGKEIERYRKMGYVNVWVLDWNSIFYRPLHKHSIVQYETLTYGTKIPCTQVDRVV